MLEEMFAVPTLPGSAASYYACGWYVDGVMADHTGSWPGYQARILLNRSTGAVGIALKNVESHDWSWVPVFDSFILD